MSYSFNFTACTKEEAKARVAIELDKIIVHQATHSRDRDAALAAAEAFIDLLSDDETKDIRVTMHGSVTYDWTAQDPNGLQAPLTQASSGVSACHVPKGVG